MYIGKEYCTLRSFNCTKLFITYINNFNVQGYIMSLRSCYCPNTMLQWVISLWVIGRSQFHIDKIQPIFTWVMIEIFYSTYQC